MSELMPEVGDVWELHGVIDYILEVNEKTMLVFYFNKSSKKFMMCIYRIKDYLRHAKYLGKSKANINELFEVQDAK